jgi:N-formylglutamate amidohydrolase
MVKERKGGNKALNEGHAMIGTSPPNALPTISHDAFLRYGTPGGKAPLVFAVPHAGRDYGPDLLARARVTPATLMRLEDRYVDLLAHDLIEQEHCVLVARRPRAMIDLNRDEREIDPLGIADLPRHVRPHSSAKVRGGLGIVPDRLAYAGSLWRYPLSYADLCGRIEQIHRPYHAMLEQALIETRQRHGTALLVDIHSMPPLRVSPISDAPPPRIVIGDRFGRSASDRLTDLMADIARRHGLDVAINTPYSGNHILERHGHPDQGIHAIQIEIDRSLYLTRDLVHPGDGIPAIWALLDDLALGLTQELSGPGLQLAAE